MKILYRIYSLLIATPLFLVVTILVASTIIVTAFLGDSKFLAYWLPHFWSRFTCFIYLIRVKVEGREHIGKRQSYVFLANHQGWFDIFLIYGYLNHNFKWMMKEYLKKLPFVGYACYKSKHVFVGDSLSSIQKTVEQARKTLRSGMSLVIFPEGTRTYDGKLQPFKRGAFMLANEIGLPIVPMTITGSYEVMNRHHKLPKFGKLHLQIHPAIPQEAHKGKPTKVFMQEVYDIINTH